MAKKRDIRPGVYVSGPGVMWVHATDILLSTNGQRQIKAADKLAEFLKKKGR